MFYCILFLITPLLETCTENYIKLVKVIVTVNDEKEVREYHVSELKFKAKRRRDNEAVDEELKQLEMLEKKEGKSKLDE